jgi:hypothetical protein
MDLNDCARLAASLLTTFNCLVRAVAQDRDAVLSVAQSADTCPVEHCVPYYYTYHPLQVTRVLKEGYSVGNGRAGPSLGILSLMGLMCSC